MPDIPATDAASPEAAAPSPEAIALATIPAAIHHAEKVFGEREAVLDRGRRIGFPEFAEQIRTAAAALIARGIGPGDRICLWAPNRLEWMLTALGAQYLGAVLVPLNTRYRGAEAVDILTRTRARLLVVEQSFLGTDYLGMLRAVGHSTAGNSAAGNGETALSTIVDLADDAPAVRAENCLSWTHFLAGATAPRIEQAQALAERVRPDDVADILFTSGTTGRSKGAMATHRQALGQARGWARRARLGPDDRYLIVNPFFHSFGYKAGYLAGLLSGALIVPQSVFDATTVLDLIEREQITVLPGPPTIYQTLLADPSLPTRGLGSLRLAVTGGAMVPQTLIRRIRDGLRIGATLTAYGLTEAPVVTMCTEQDDDPTVATTCGPPLDWAELRTVGPHGVTDPGVPGEVQIRGPNVMLGYLDDPEATAAAIDPDGWLHTGDVGILDERGYLQITDRIKDMFTVGGFNVYPAEVEQVITSHPLVQDCAVIGVPDERLGEVGRAYICLQHLGDGTMMDAEQAAAQIVTYCRERLANFKVPRAVVLVDALPRNAGGKVVKTQLRQQAHDGR